MAVDDIFLWGITDEQKGELKELKKNHLEDLKSWTIFSVFLPLITFGFAVVTNLVYSTPSGVKAKWGTFLNNGSLPIIAFGIMSSSLPYMVEKLSLSGAAKDTIIYSLRKRVVAIVAAVMFLASGLFIIQSLSFLQNNHSQNTLLAIGGLIVTIWATILGRAMFLTQSMIVERDVAGDINDKTKQQKVELANQFPTSDDDE